MRRTPSGSRITPALLLLVAALTAACSAPSAATGTPAAATQQAAASVAPGASATATATPVVYVGHFQLSPQSGDIGSQVTAAGTGFAKNADLSLLWQQITGSWNVNHDDGTYHGEQYASSLVPLTTAHTDDQGAFTTTFTVPSGFGFTHNVLVQQGDAVRNQAGFNVNMEVSVSPRSGPPGTPITVTAHGVGWAYLYNVWQVVYDNKFTGWFSAVSTNGDATAVIPATGVVGRHVVQVTGGIPTFPYLNTPQSPTPDRPTFTFMFDVTDGAPVLPKPVADQGFAPQPRSAPSGTAGPSIYVDPTSGAIKTPITIHGSGFTAGQQIDLQWFRVVGNRVGGGGWAQSSTSVGTATAGTDGTFALPLQALDDLGGGHEIDAQVDGKTVAKTDFTITPSALALTPAAATGDGVAPGTMLTVHLKGVGWTETANIYTLVYDNAYLGYACGFNSQGDVTIEIPAAGGPGWHFIDLYPAIYKGDETKGVETFRIPQLTYAKDHPGEPLPALHYAVHVTANGGT